MSTVVEFTNRSEDAVRLALSSLQGLRLSRTFHILDSQCLEFGELSQRNDIVEAPLRLTLQCPWRLEKGPHIITGLDDARVTEEEELSADGGRSLLSEKLAAVLHMETDEGIVPMDVQLNVGDVRTDELGGFQVALSGGFMLSVFPAGSVDEYWRLAYVDWKWHFVVEAGRVYGVGEQLPPLFRSMH